MTEKIFEMRHIDKLYGSLLANDDVSIHLNRGEILCLVGENGAGKSTIMKILYGLEPPSGGEIFVKGEKVHFHTPSDAMARGIGMVQQHFMLFESMTVAENIVFKNEIRKGLFMDMKQTIETVRELSEKYGLKIDPEAKIEDCPVGLRQRVEILKILYQSAEIIIFDEPSAVLTPLEVESLLETIKSLAAAGKSIVLITHKLQEVMAVADRIYVMRAGKVVAERLRKETDTDELAFLMVGHHPALREIAAPQTGSVLLETRGLSLHREGRDILKNIDLHVDSGTFILVGGTDPERLEPFREIGAEGLLGTCLVFPVIQGGHADIGAQIEPVAEVQAEVHEQVILEPGTLQPVVLSQFVGHGTVPVFPDTFGQAGIQVVTAGNRKEQAGLVTRHGFPGGVGQVESPVKDGLGEAVGLGSEGGREGSVPVGARRPDPVRVIAGHVAHEAEGNALQAGLIVGIENHHHPTLGTLNRPIWAGTRSSKPMRLPLPSSAVSEPWLTTVEKPMPGVMVNWE